MGTGATFLIRCGKLYRWAIVQFYTGHAPAHWPASQLPDLVLEFCLNLRANEKGLK